MASIRYYRNPEHPWFQMKACDGMSQASRRHAHDRLSVVLVTGGSSLVRFGSEEHAVTQGQLVLIGSGFVHQCLPDAVDAWHFMMLQIEESWVAECGLPAPERPCFIVRTLSGKEYAMLHTLFSCLCDAAPDPEESVLEILDIVVNGQAEPSLSLVPDSGANPSIQAVARRLREQPGEAFSLTEMATLAETSRFSLIRAFRAAYGSSPHAWQNMIRLEEARRLLEAGRPILDVTHDLGFYDQSHFSRLFKESFGVSANQYLGNRPPPP